MVQLWGASVLSETFGYLIFISLMTSSIILLRVLHPSLFFAFPIVCVLMVGRFPCLNGDIVKQVRTRKRENIAVLEGEPASSRRS